jgi:hypothetical protein
VAEDAVRSETVSRADLAAICVYREIFTNCRESRLLLPVKFPNGFKILEGVLPT